MAASRAIARDFHARLVPGFEDGRDASRGAEVAAAFKEDRGSTSTAAFGHPIGASGLRMMYEMWLQRRGEAGPRQITSPELGLTHNLGGAPGRCVSLVAVVGR